MTILQNEYDNLGLGLAELDPEVIKRYSSTVEEYGHTGYWEWDLKNQKFFFSDKMYQLYGIESGVKTLTSEMFRERVHSDDIIRLQAALKRSLEKNKEYDITYRVVVNNKISYLRSRAKLIRNSKEEPLLMYGTCQCVTETFEKTKKQNENLKFLKDLIEYTPLALLVINEVGEIIFVDSKLLDMTGYSRDELIEQSLGKIVPKQFHRSFLSLFQDNITTRTTETRLAQTELKTKSGEIVNVEFTLKPSSYNGEKVAIAIINDFSAKINNLKVIAGTVKHHLNNSLMVAKATLERVNQQDCASLQDQKFQEDLNLSLRSINKTLKIIKNLEDTEIYKKQLYYGDEFIIDID